MKDLIVILELVMWIIIVWLSSSIVYAYEFPFEPTSVTIHHTAGVTGDSIEKAKWDMYHRHEGFVHKGRQNYSNWSPIAYHFIVDGKWNYEQTRAKDTRGAHQAGYNSSSYGIAMIWSYNHVSPSIWTYMRLTWIIIWLEKGVWRLLIVKWHHEQIPWVNETDGTVGWCPWEKTDLEFIRSLLDLYYINQLWPYKAN